jgi:YidC/Oxa1 family membrane protein insertase
MDFLGLIAKPLGMLLTGTYQLVGNYGVALIILTAVVKGALYPLYIKQMKSTLGMQDLQPKMQAIQEKYANDREKQNEAMQELYKQEDFNPMGGCLPMIIQFPIIMGLFALLRNPMKYLSDDMLFAVHEKFLWIPDLGQPDRWVLPIIAGVATYFAFSMNQQNMTTDIGGQNQTQAMNAIMKYFFPLSIIWLARSYPAGLAIYWAGGQIMQIFFNLHMNSVRRKAQEEREQKRKVERAEKELQRRKNARLAKVKGSK